METLNYSKKRLEPSIKKFGIDPEMDMVFKSIVDGLFPKQTDYQLWAIKVIYSHVTTLDDLIRIKEWADANPTEISNLSLKNIVSYKTVTDFATLHEEISSLDAFHFVKNFLNSFNTDQRKLLRDTFISPIEETPYSALKNRTFSKFHDTVKTFSSLPDHRKAKFITLMSAVRSVEKIMTHMKSAISQSYDWNREDFLCFLNANFPKAEICYDNNNVVVIRLDNFTMAERLCGKGRTSWCLTRQGSYFNQYTKDNGNAQQYALFDFNLKENHDLAHVGFSVRPGKGVNYAHSTKNHNLMSNVTVNGEDWDIVKVLNHHNIPKTAYVRLKKLTNYKWDKKSFLYGLNKRYNGTVSELSDGRIVVEINDSKVYNYMLGHTLTDEGEIAGSRHSKVFAVIDFTKEVNDDNSIILAVYDQDVYGTLSISKVINTYGEREEGFEALKKHNIKDEDFISGKELAPDVLLHKYIDTGNVEAAIKLLSERGDVDPNTVFFNNIPVIKAIILGDKQLFDAIINCPGFNCNWTEGFGEPFVHFILLYMRSTPDISDYKVFVDMCLSLLDKENYDKMKKDPTGDTALHTACECGDCALPVVDRLLSDPSVDVNSKNNFGYTPLMVAVECGSHETINRLIAHPGIEISEEEIEFAHRRGIKITAEETAETHQSGSTGTVDDDYEDLFARAFASID